MIVSSGKSIQDTTYHGLEVLSVNYTVVQYMLNRSTSVHVVPSTHTVSLSACSNSDSNSDSNSSKTI